MRQESVGEDRGGMGCVGLVRPGPMVGCELPPLQWLDGCSAHGTRQAVVVLVDISDGAYLPTGISTAGTCTVRT